MRHITILFVFVFTIVLNAQFTVTGTLKNYTNKDLKLKIFNGATTKLVSKVKTNTNGFFSVKVPTSYSGIVRLEINNGLILDFLSDNENVELTADVISDGGFENIEYQKGKTVIAYQKYIENEPFRGFKKNIFPILKESYKIGDPFYTAIEKEEARIEDLPESDIPLIQYYLNLKELAETSPQGLHQVTVTNDEILKHLTNDNLYLENSSLMYQLVMNYLLNSIQSAQSQEQINSILDEKIQTLIDKTDIETSRGQNVLNAVFLVLPNEHFSELLDKYYSKVNELTCHITDELKSAVNSHINITEGKQVPNIKFSNKVKGYQSLYDVKSNQKVLIFWASWCPACNEEMPFVKEFYRNFKEAGGEIVSISLDFDPQMFKDATSDMPWVNYSDFLKWDSPIVKEFGIQATPTLFLLDKDNKIIKKAAHISEIMEAI